MPQPESEYSVLLDTEITSPATFKDLHWLPVCKQIVYKLLVITYKIYNLGPEYLRDLIEPLMNHLPEYALNATSRQVDSGHINV